MSGLTFAPVTRGVDGRDEPDLDVPETEGVPRPAWAGRRRDARLTRQAERTARGGVIGAPPEDSYPMSSKMRATFATRREAELVVERLVQEIAFARDAIHVGPEGDENSAGEARSGGDQKAADPSVEARDDAALEARIIVTVDLDGRDDGDAVRSAFREFDGEPPA